MSDISDGDDDSPSERTAIRRSVQNTAPQLASSKWYYPRRYVVAVMAFFGFANVYAMRVNLSVAIVAMTTNKTIVYENGTTYIQPAEFDWNSDIQGIILSSFFYGYILTQLPGGFLAAAYGGKRLFGIGITVTSIFTLLTPLFTKYSMYLLVGARVMEGLFEGFTYPAMHAMWSRWAPPLERSKLAMIAISGCYFGTVIALPLSGVLADYLGWPSIFYFSGAIAYAWSIFWFFYIKDKPQNDPKISEDELCYIRSTLRSQYPYVKTSPIPWKRMLLSYPVWAIVIAHFSENWGFYTLLTELPTFMRDVFGYDLHKSGMMISLPYLAMGVFVLLSGWIADRLRSQGVLSTVRVRKLFNCSGFLFQTIFLLIAAHSSSPVALLVCLTAAVGFGGFAWSGFGVNHLDIAPPYASILMGISNTFATLPGMISPILTGYLIQNKTQEEWQAVFYIAAGIYLIGAIFYGIFASGEEQPWAHIDSGLFGYDDSTKSEDLPFGEASCE